MLSVYIRMIYYMRKTDSGKKPYPARFPRVRLPRFLYLATGNETVDNCAHKFLNLVSKLQQIVAPEVMRSYLGRKYAKEFTSESVDPRISSIANKGQQFFIEKVIFL